MIYIIMKQQKLKIQWVFKINYSAKKKVLIKYMSENLYLLKKKNVFLSQPYA